MPERVPPDIAADPGASIPALRYPPDRTSMKGRRRTVQASRRLARQAPDEIRQHVGIFVGTLLQKDGK
jgi:hypothetical protein